jgi:hypothetical protein
MNEIWKKIHNYESYEISSLGNIRSIKKQLSPFHNGKGYLYVNLCENGIRKTVSIHRLVGEAFILNPNNKPQINHIDCNKENNCMDNLEWVSNGENTKHAYDNYLRKPIGTPVIQYDLNNNQLNKFETILNASKITGVGHMSIRKCCIGERNTAGGFIWKYNSN